MKVAEIMQTTVDSVSPETTVMEASRIIFGRGHTGLPVVSGKKRKLIGFLTEQDILETFFPSMSEYVEDYVHTRDFEVMEQKVREIMHVRVKDIMSKKAVRVFAKDPLLKAQSIMQTRNVSRLPVTDSDDHLIGIISKADIFRVLIGESIPNRPYEGFYDWISPLYDPMIDWDQRLRNEIPDIVAFCKKHNYRFIIDVGCGTGEHSIALAERGFVVTGVDGSTEMINRAEKKLLSLPLPVRKRLTFLTLPDFLKTAHERKENYDLGIFLGSALSHFAGDKRILQPILNTLKPESSLFLQVWNLEKLAAGPEAHPGISLKTVQKSKDTKLLFVRFFDHNGKTWQHTTAIFYFDTVKWILQGINSVPVIYLDKTTLSTFLKQFGFTKLTFFGGELYGSLVSQPFDPKQSNWLNAIAQRTKV